MDKEKVIKKIKQGAPATSAIVVAACIGMSLSGYQAPVYEALYSNFHFLLLLGGLLNNLGLSFRTRWIVRPYLAFEQGFSHVQEIQPSSESHKRFKKS